MMLTMTLSVNRDQSMGGGGKLYEKQVMTDFVPMPGIDSVFLWRDEEDGYTAGPAWDVKRRYMDANGGWHVELKEMRVDPEEPMQRAMQTESGRRYMAVFWESDAGFDVEEKLVHDGGWKRWTGRTA